MKLIPHLPSRGWRCRKGGYSVNTVTRTCRGCGLVVARAISNDHYEAESTGPAYQPPVHVFPDEDTPLGALRPPAGQLAESVRPRKRRLRILTTSSAR